MPEDPPQFPAGEFVEPGEFSADLRNEWVKHLRNVPQRAQQLVSDLTDDQLDTKYRNWTIRQIIHHIVDSHINCYVRFKWALTEEEPTIKAYDESRWSELPDARTAPIGSSLKMLDALHHRWCDMIDRLSDSQMQLGFYHPELEKVVRLEAALPAYVWHSDHHLAQIEWVRTQHGW